MKNKGTGKGKKTSARRILTEEVILRFAAWLRAEEKSRATVEKYLRDARAYAVFLDGAEATGERTAAYKQRLIGNGYAVRSVNAMLAGLNSLFAFLGWPECRVKSLRIQRQIYCPAERELSREEYLRLCRTAQARGDRKLSLILQTVCGTGIRVSELPFITAEAAENGRAVISLKGKTRTVFLDGGLREKLLGYAKEEGIRSGALFVTRTGKPVSRVCVWRAMKSLCGEAGVDPRKVFPHNLRHLFARLFYELEKDIAGLADLLGHSSIDTTRIYTAGTGEEYRRKMERMQLIL